MIIVQYYSYMDEPVMPPSGTVPNQPAVENEPVVPPPDAVSPTPEATPAPPPPSSPQEKPVSGEGESGPSVPSDQAFAVPAAPPSGNPFAPNIPTGSPSAGRTFPKRLVVILAIIVIALLLVVVGKFILGAVTGGGMVTLQYWGLWENDATMQSVLAQFETTYPKIKVVYTKQSPRQYRERLQSAIERGEGPDVYRFHNTWVPMLRSQLEPAPAKLMTSAEFASTFYPVASSDLVGGQSIYGMPIMFDGLGLFYNEDLFASAGVTPPTTWEEVLNIVPKLTVRSESTIMTSAIALGTTGNIENASDIVATMMMQNGASLTNPTGKQAEETLIFYRKFANPDDPVYTWNDSMDNSIYAFASGKVAMILAPSWRVFDVKEINPNFRFKVVPIPQLPGNTVTWASYWVEGVSSKGKHTSQAWDLVAYMTSRDVVSKFYTEASKSRLFGEPYARVDLGNTIQGDPYVGAYVAQAQTAKSFPLASRTFDNGINDKLIKYLTDAINAVGAGTAPTAALNTAAAGFRQVLESYGLTVATAQATP
jgi:multiple sugar transport system substrate-binding protein